MPKSHPTYLTRRRFLTAAAASAAGFASLNLLKAQTSSGKGTSQPVKIGYLAITDSTPLLIAHANKLYEAEGLNAEQPVLFRSWAQISEAFIAGQVNVVHLLSPIAIWLRYNKSFPAKIVAWNHTNGSALTVQPDMKSIKDLGGKTVAVPLVFDSNRYLPDRADELVKELTLLQAETEVLGSTPLDPVPEYSRAVMRLRLRSAQLASQAAQSAVLHAGAKGFIVSSAPQRRIREAMFYSILTPSIKHLRKELS
jgi:NMT1-like family